LKLEKWLPCGINHRIFTIDKKETTLKVNTKRRKKARKGFRQIYGENELLQELNKARSKQEDSELKNEAT